MERELNDSVGVLGVTEMPSASSRHLKHYVGLYLNEILKSRGKAKFLRSLALNARLLDVGCGNSSPMKAKIRRPDLIYTGLDVGDYHQTLPERFADEYIVTTPARFTEEIRQFEGQMDAVISSHNIEHCIEPEAVLVAMMMAIKPGGHLYMAFPCEESVRFPKRRGTLNFYDDDTHATVPKWEVILKALRRAGFTIDFAARRYRPFVLAAVGFLFEPMSAASKRASHATWALYGFESIIWASRPTI